MICPNCGTTDVNDMLIDFQWSNGRNDTTTLPKYLHYLRYPTIIGENHPVDITTPHETGEKPGVLPMVINLIWCDQCSITSKKDREIPPTRYGV